MVGRSTIRPREPSARSGTAALAGAVLLMWEAPTGDMIVLSKWELTFSRMAFLPGFVSGLCRNNVDSDCGLISACC
jgi:hypothetical protein